jgi:hypothetical protein
MTLKAVQFLALVLTALALIPSGAHLCAPEQNRPRAGAILDRAEHLPWLEPVRHCLDRRTDREWLWQSCCAAGARRSSCVVRFLLRRSQARDFLRLDLSDQKTAARCVQFGKRATTWPRSARRASYNSAGSARAN